MLKSTIIHVVSIWRVLNTAQSPNNVAIVETIVHDDVGGFMESFVASEARIALFIERINRQEQLMIASH